MSLTPRLFFEIPNGWAAGGVLLATGVAAGFGVFAALRVFPNLPAAPESPVSSARDPAPSRAGRPSIPLEGWSVFRMDGEAVREVADSLAGRFRLAGTFRIVQASGSSLKAVLTDLVRSNSSVVAVGDMLEDDIRVDTIEERRVELVRRDVRCELTLQAAGRGAGSNDTVGADGLVEDTRGYEVISRGRFGLQVAEDRWLFERKKVLEYYNAVLEDADRLVSVFDSLKPLYNDKQRIAGYILAPEGEKEFFKEVGMREGDILRKVNKMPLMNRRVAEGFIRDFADNNLNVCVLDIEREGRPQQLIFEFR